MIIQEFSFGNFRSFKDIQTLNLTAAKIKSKNPEIDKINVIEKLSHENRMLKSKAIYGANASGKSNVIKAMGTFLRIIGTSVKEEKVLNMVDSFRLSTETEDEPSFFQMIFWIEDTRYRYGFEASDEQIHSEWLYARPNEREIPYFIRDSQEIIDIDKTNFLEGHKLISLLEDGSEDNEIFRKNSLFLSSLSAIGFGKISKLIIKNLTSITIINGLGDEGMYAFAGDSLEDKSIKNYILKFLKYGDIGIDNIETLEVNKDEINPTPSNEKKRDEPDEIFKLLLSVRKKFNESAEFQENESLSLRFHESEGTLKLFELSPFIYRSLKSKTPLIIDEFDARFHPLLTKKIVELYNSSQNSDSQLIFTTHDTNLLSADLLRRDQIEFVEKDKFGSSHLYSLVEFKGIRNTASFRKDYIQGKYGAIPFLGDFSKLNSLEDA